MSLRTQLFNRSRGYCEHCGWPLGSNWALHHRRLRSHGGKDDLTNVLALRHDCHNGKTDAVHMRPADSHRDGYIVLADADPAQTPVLLRGNLWVLLTEDGRYEAVPAPEE